MGPFFLPSKEGVLQIFLKDISANALLFQALFSSLESSSFQLAVKFPHLFFQCSPVGHIMTHQQGISQILATQEYNRPDS